jgi:hypothetical protein
VNLTDLAHRVHILVAEIALQDDSPVRPLLVLRLVHHGFAAEMRRDLRLFAHVDVERGKNPSQGLAHEWGNLAQSLHGVPVELEEAKTFRNVGLRGHGRIPEFHRQLVENIMLGRRGLLQVNSQDLELCACGGTNYSGRQS